MYQDLHTRPQSELSPRYTHDKVRYGVWSFVWKRVAWFWTGAALAIFLGGATAHAQSIRQPEPAALPAPIAQPKDVPFAGTVELQVDATDVQRRVLNVHERVPVKGGAELTLLYPKWIPGNHSPTGPIARVAGLVITADGKRVPWVRDRVDVYAFHIPVPAGATTIEASYQYLAPVKDDEGRLSQSSKILDLAWNAVVLYPAGYFARRIPYRATLTLPEGWQFASALTVEKRDGKTVHFQTTALNTLVDSPLYAGLYYQRLDLSTGADNPVFLDLFGDTKRAITLTPEQVQWHRNLAEQAQKLYRSHHYDHYDFLFSISDVVGGIGLEHHQSSEDGTKANYFTDWEKGIADRDLLAHEYSHSWDGKFRRPADLWTADYDVPMQDDLLWVYEGMTQYLGYVLTARSGLRTEQQTRDLIALTAANYEISPGRDWRPLIDTTNQPTMTQRSPVTWVSWQRPEDYYSEGMLIWLDADTKIRQLSNGAKSLDDFARLFYGVNNGSFVTQTYKLDDVVTALNQVQPYDWAHFLQARVYELAPSPPENGIMQGGYRLVYNDEPIAWQKEIDKEDKGTSFATSLGFAVKDDGTLQRVWWDSPAFKAGITPDMQVLAVNGSAFKVETLRTAILEAEKDKAPLRFLLKRENEFETLDVDYHGGLRYPHLERVDGKLDLLHAVFSPLS